MKFFGLYFIFEIILLVIVGRFLGVGLTLFIIVATSLIGVMVVRSAGLSTVMKMRQMTLQATHMNAEVMHSMWLGVAGLLLFLPGLLGNIIGVLLIFPVTRGVCGTWAKKILPRLNTQFSAANKYSHYTSEHRSQEPDIIEGEWERKK